MECLGFIRQGPSTSLEWESLGSPVYICCRKCGGIALVQAGGCVVLSVVGHVRALPPNLLSVVGRMKALPQLI